MSEYEPITGELREMMGGVEPRVDDDGVVTAKYVTPDAWGEFVHRCDAIDAVHAALERENAELRQRVAELDKRGDSMHDGGRITDELRAWWVRKYPVMDKELHREFTTIVDRIDEEHERQCAESWMRGHDAWAAIDRSDEMAEHGWVRLPKDADGEPIRVGDELAGYGYPNGGAYCKAIVGEWGILAGEQDCNYQRWLLWSVDAVRHYHAPTVEDVLTKFGIDWEHEDNCEDRAALLKEYAAKLRLAGDAS